MCDGDVVPFFFEYVVDVLMVVSRFHDDLRLGTVEESEDAILVLAQLRFPDDLSLIILQDALYRFLMQVERCVHELGCGFPSLYPLRASHLVT